MITFAAWVLAGIALWFTHGVLDMFGDGRHSTRVAMLPSMAELAGLIALALLISAGVASTVRRWSHSRPDRETTRLQIALPLFSLGIIGLPYLPWLPDWILPLRALAGPMTLVIWIVVAGQMLATALTLKRRVLKDPPYDLKRRVLEDPPYGIVVILLATVAITGAAGWTLRDSLTYPNGDEPHHMIMMQSVWRDHDLQLQNNYDRLDYEEYFPSSLEPAPPKAIGLAILGAPVFAWGGYHGLMWMQVLLTAMTAVMMWRWAFAYTGAGEAATTAWAAVFLGAPILLTSFAIYPEVPAAFCVMVALAWRSAPQRTDTFGTFVIRGLAVSALPWFSLTYAPLAAALIVILGLRGRSNRRAVMATLLIFSFSLVACIFATQSRVDSRPELGNAITGMLGLLFDQEYGVLPYAPALTIGLVALWRMAAARDHVTRRHGRELAVVLLAQLVAVGSLDMWWGGAAPPGRMLVPVLPALGLPIAWAAWRGFESPVRRAAYQLLVFVGMAVSSAMVLAQDGGLISQDRDGSARLLQWLTELWPAWEAVPSIAGFGLRQSAPLVALWVVVAAAVAWLCARPSKRSPGTAAVLAAAYVSAGVLVAASLGPALARPRFEWVLEPESRSRVPMLDNYDAIVRPHAIIYNPFTFTRATSIPPLMTLSAFPGQRPAGQPVRVLLNARYALPAGEYEVEIGGLPAGSEPAHGVVGLQVGRIGGSLHKWDVTLSPGGTWRTTFVLPVDVEFVGLVAESPLDTARSLRIRPQRIQNRSRRESIFHGARPLSVLSALELPAVSLFFHDEEVYREEAGFWVRGGSTAVMTVAPQRPGNGVTVRMHSGAQPNTMTLVTTTWGAKVALAPGTTREIHVPPPPQEGPFILRVTADAGFVPADVIPGSTDRRLLGAWMELAN